MVDRMQMRISLKEGGRVSLVFASRVLRHPLISRDSFSVRTLAYLFSNMFCYRSTFCSVAKVVR